MKNVQNDKSLFFATKMINGKPIEMWLEWLMKWERAHVRFANVDKAENIEWKVYV